MHAVIGPMRPKQYTSEFCFDLELMLVVLSPRCVNQLVRDQCRVNTYIDAHLKVRSVATIHELLQCVQKFCCTEADNTAKEFSSLHLGPFLQQPYVYDNFQAPTDLEEIPEIDTGDILMYLRGKQVLLLTIGYRTLFLILIFYCYYYYYIERNHKCRL